MMSADVIKLSSVTATLRCPTCSTLVRKRWATEDGTLWEMSEVCIMCGWSRTTENVKIGV